MFFLFAGETYYNNKGWGDFIRSYPTQAEAVAAGRGMLFTQVMTQRDRDEDLDPTTIMWWQVVDAKAEKIVETCFDDQHDEETNRLYKEWMAADPMKISSTA